MSEQAILWLIIGFALGFFVHGLLTTLNIT